MATTSTQNAQYAVNYLQNKGWTKEQAAGIVANLQQESGPNLNTRAFNAAGGGQGAQGVAQWRGSRLTDASNFLGGKNVRDASLDEQLDFVNYELTQGKEKSAGNKIRATNTAEDAAIATDKFYERSGGESQAARVAKAQALMGGASGTYTPPTPSAPTTNAPKTEPDTTVGTPDYAGGPKPAPEIILDPIPNPLRDYPSYTYNLSLHLLSKPEYNAVSNDETYVAKRVLIASAGRKNINTFIRSPYFNEDFYFEDLEMETIVGANATNRATNAIRMTFTIIEPYGLTLIDRIMDACREIDPQGNYIDMPYLLQIDFFAHNDAGEIVGVLKEHTKYIPIRIIKLEVSTGPKGSEYKCEAVPYGHSAYDINSITTPVHFEIVAGSVAGFFQSTESETYIQESERSQGQNAQPQTLSADAVYKVKSYGSAINAYQQDLVKKNLQKVADTYYFKFYGGIGESKFILGEKLGQKDTPMSDPSNNITSRLASAGAKTNDVDYGNRVFAINTGTSLEQIINHVIRISDYVQSQLIVKEEYPTPEAYKAAVEAKANLPFMWIKIIPKIQLTEYDKIRKAFGRTITYHVIPYEIYNTKISSTPQGVTKSPLKDYQYYYTGKNTEIIDLDIQFNALYYTAVAAYKTNVATLYDLAADETSKTTAAENYEGSGSDPNAIQPMAEKVDPPPLQSKNATQITARAATTAEVQESIYTQPGGDMIDVNVKIIGDPTFIKQDDVFYGPKDTTNLPAAQGTPADPRLTPNNSIKTDGKEMYISITFRSPIDVDEATGLMNFDDKYKQSRFTGFYRVLRVTSNFSGGQFVQTLNAIRLPRQASKDTGSAVNKNKERQESLPPGQAGITYTEPEIPPILRSRETSNTDADVAPGNNPFFDPVPPILDSSQQRLRAVAETAPTSAISEFNEPQEFAPNFTPISVRGNQLPGERAIT